MISMLQEKALLMHTHLNAGINILSLGSAHYAVSLD